MIHPYGEIRKVPLDYQGIKSTAYAVQRQEIKDEGLKWKECGVVGSNYLLVPNSEVRDLANEIATESALTWEPMKTFFNGKQFAYFMQCKSDTTEIAKDDDIALGMAFWNSYDGSTALQFRTFLVRLVCTNGMITKDFMNLMKFKHNKTSEGYDKQIINAAKVVDNCGEDIETVAKRMRKMVETPVDLNELAYIRNNYLGHLPVTLWGKISSHFLQKHDRDIFDDNVNMWDFYNACTDILWHDKKPTMASLEHNQVITDRLLGAMS
ncbi:MAG: hypothetical protein Unbinned3338contig1000_44 [Prokaryotic dsDNA virus sp.]|nr:MAG: hypothetical protein Unbinned3338contig1000_44 [Prokaryotic dsDNA virus sp.]|tara:strand:+ start:9180 stop:9977 length:798 start_codon:yes stop_codon:yes gene_type:complete